MTQRWQKLALDFRQVPDWFNQLEVSREQYQDGTPPGAWILSGSLPERYRNQFEEIARSAGKELITDPAVRPQLPNEVIQEPDYLDRWFTAIQFMTAAYREPALQWESDDGETRCVILCGRIDRPLEASIALCRQLSAHEREPSTTVVATDRVTRTGVSKSRTVRAEIVRQVMASARDFKNPAKIKELCARLDAAGIPVPARGVPHGSDRTTWSEIAELPRGSQYKRLFHPRNSGLVKDLRLSRA